MDTCAVSIQPVSWRRLAANGQLKSGCNVQIAANNEYITGVAVFSNRTDSGNLQSFLRQIERQYGQKYQKIVAYARYKSVDNYLFLEESGQLSFIKPINYVLKRKRRVELKLVAGRIMQYDEQKTVTPVWKVESCFKALLML